MKLMSFTLTAEQVRNRTKFVTRRIGWLKAKPGDIYLAVEKARGVPIAKRVVLGKIRVKSVRKEPLMLLTHYSANLARDEMNSEGFPLLNVGEFIELFCGHMRCKPDQIVTRIEFCYENTPTTP